MEVQDPECVCVCVCVCTHTRPGVGRGGGEGKQGNMGASIWNSGCRTQWMKDGDPVV